MFERQEQSEDSEAVISETGRELERANRLQADLQKEVAELGGKEEVKSLISGFSEVKQEAIAEKLRVQYAEYVADMKSSARAILPQGMFPKNKLDLGGTVDTRVRTLTALLDITGIPAILSAGIGAGGAAYYAVKALETRLEIRKAKAS